MFLDAAKPFPAAPPKRWEYDRTRWSLSWFFRGVVCQRLGFCRRAAPVYQPPEAREHLLLSSGAKPALIYNHDVDIVKFKGMFFAAWNATRARAEDVPGQYNFLSISDDFEHWSAPVRLFTKDAAAENPVETDNQWQPIFINCRDETLFCAWCDYNARKTYVATSTDGPLA